MREIAPHYAIERLSAMRATVNAIGMSFGKEGSALPKSVTDDIRTGRLEG